MAGEDWLESFPKRNSNLGLRKPKMTSGARSFSFNKTALNEFFLILETVYSKRNFTTDLIFNFDESGMSTVCNTSKVSANKSRKYVGQIVSTESGELVKFGGIIAENGYTIPIICIPEGS